MDKEDFEKISVEKTLDFSLAAQKSLFMLNGSAAIALLAFWGNAKEHTFNREFGWAIALLAAACALSVIGMFMTREAQSKFTDINKAAGEFLNRWITIFCNISMAIFFVVCALVLSQTCKFNLFLSICIALSVFLIMAGGYWFIIHRAQKLENKNQANR